MRASFAAAKLLAEFEKLPLQEKQAFVCEVMHHLPPWNCGPLDDAVASAAGDELAGMLEQEERAFK